MKKDRYNDLEELYVSLAKPLFYYLLKLTGSHTVAEDLVQETFYRATLSLDLYEDQEVKSWLFKVARNAYMDEWRKKQRWQWIPFYDYLSYTTKMVSPYGVPEQALTAKEMKRDVIDIMSLLPENYRTILYLREYKQFTYDELAEVMELSLAQVKVNLHRARQRFKQLSERFGKDFKRGDEHGME